MEFVGDGTALLTGSAYVRGWERCRSELAEDALVSDGSLAGLGQAESNNLLLMEGEPHQTLRRLVRSHLTKAHLDAVLVRLEAVADELLQTVLSDPEADLVTGLAEPLVLEAIMSVLGIPADRRARLGELTRKMLGLLEPDLPPDRRRVAVNAGMRATLLFERDAKAGRAAGFHAALEAAAEAGEIPVKTARSTPVVMLHGGYENPLNQLGCLVAWAVENPERFAGVAEDAPAVLVEEVLRVYSPVRLVARWAAADGEGFRRGQFAWVDLESANLDGDRFAQPHDLDFSRKRGHMSFGHGRHVCPGAALARLEGRALIAALRRIPPDVLGGFTATWRDGVVARGPLTIARR
ncbi:cytochrome P450 [Actinomadura litoris]|uniref:Cytochrome P450 n=1 Tax=Actinomadura litoris TaxID=2678616 RepID=A0A7K1L9B9_9ACTN|nr:cytochrome P450 [Actinomadura litoris]MUN40933.1 hypothetical protein [Actinomadura litoris]